MIGRLKACLNGTRTRDEHPAVPLTPAELAVATAAVVAAGAEAVHVHPRGVDGTESLRADDVSAAVAAIREACPATSVGVSTGLWICGGDAAARLAAVSGWDSAARPDFASVNVSEPGWMELVGVLHNAGITTEAGVWSMADADALGAWTPAQGWLRVLVEVVDAPAASAVRVADEILSRLDQAGVTAPRLLHGEGTACWPLVAHAGRAGLPTRMGLEDTILGPAGEVVADNTELVRLALAMWTRARSRS